MYRLDKSFSKISTLKEASSNYDYWQTKTVEERLAAAVYLIKTAYRIEEFPRMDKTVFSTRKLSEK
jgi:hypothetical protein